MTENPFPKDFWWGVATSAFQVEGAVDEDGRSPSIWDTFTHTPGKIRDGSNADVATDHYHRFREDVGLMRELGVNAYRFSIAWSRILPGGTGEVNEAGVGFYRRLCEELIASGITPVATLYHWDLPQALQDRGGWLSPESRRWFAEYAAVTKQALGDLVSVWATLNEPWCAAFLGHSAGEHAPGLTDPGSGFVAAHNLMLAHHDAITVMRENRIEGDQLGVVLNLIPAWPASADPADAHVAEAVDMVQNRLFLEAVFNGSYPDQVREFHRRYGVDDRIDVDELAAARQPIDFLGVNYYNVNRVRHAPGAPAPGPWPGAEEAVIVTPEGPLTDMGWAVDPEGLTWTLKRVATEYPALPLVVCENGAAYPDAEPVDGTILDTDRIRYLESHIEALAEAIRQGVDVRGYFVWSLLDNFEWAKGYTMRFGIVHVDPKTLKRTIKASGYWYRDHIARVSGDG
ncbi:MAG TPA: GH1 family beta-glucosidase [Acidimicrobiia bacterium]|jgi:beta-glucosidase